MTHPPSDHFHGKSVLEHLKEARTRGMIASAEVHGTEMSGHMAAFADSLRDASIALLFLWVILSSLIAPSHLLPILALFSIGWVIWKTSRSAMIGWSRLERLHRLIEEERWEIQHHRHQEREELTELYQAKGFEGKLLEEAIDVLMADDNRLLQIMLEEEMGLTLEAYEHPLKQAFGAFAGSMSACLFCLAAFLLYPWSGLPIVAAVLTFAGSICTSKLERNHIMPAVVWNAAILTAACLCLYFVKQILLHTI